MKEIVRRVYVSSLKVENGSAKLTISINPSRLKFSIDRIPASIVNDFTVRMEWTATQKEDGKWSNWDSFNGLITTSGFSDVFESSRLIRKLSKDTPVEPLGVLEKMRPSIYMEVVYDTRYGKYLPISMIPDESWRRYQFKTGDTDQDINLEIISPNVEDARKKIASLLLEKNEIETISKWAQSGMNLTDTTETTNGDAIDTRPLAEKISVLQNLSEKLSSPEPEEKGNV